ncbi:MAG: NfeD family protein [Hyphomicrobiaceae bacterium]|nr:NfeD family protein [Hyphomicrobiaceae bacterium]
MQAIVDYLWSLGVWHWFFLAIILFVLETVLPGVHLLWFGLAAVLVGLLALGTDIAWQWQVIAFGVVSMLSVFWVRRYARPDVVVSDQPDLNVRGQQYVGRVVTVDEPISGGRGRVRVGDTVWVAEGPDLPKGARAKVMAAHGTVLVVEPVPV